MHPESDAKKMRAIKLEHFGRSRRNEFDFSILDAFCTYRIDIYRIFFRVSAAFFIRISNLRAHMLEMYKVRAACNELLLLNFGINV